MQVCAGHSGCHRGSQWGPLEGLEQEQGKQCNLPPPMGADLVSTASVSPSGQQIEHLSA